MMRTLWSVALAVFLIGTGDPVQALTDRLPHHIQEFPAIDLRWSKDDAIIAFARENIGRLDVSADKSAEYDAVMRRFLASVYRNMSGGELSPDLSSFTCEHFKRPLGERWSIKLDLFSLCFLNNALVLVNAQYAEGVSASEITEALDSRYKRSPRGDFWFEDKPLDEQLVEVIFQKQVNTVSYINKRTIWISAATWIINGNGVTAARTGGTTRIFFRGRNNTVR